jgi:hypothetical protein
MSHTPGSWYIDNDARLIAAAPDLLAACKSVLESLERNLAMDYLPETKATLRGVIAKAESP